MSFRAVKSPLAPKMTMEQGSSALRSEPMWQGGASSVEIKSFTRPTMTQSAAKFNASCVGVQAWACFSRKPSRHVGLNSNIFRNCSPGAAIFHKISRREHESKNHHHPKKGRGGPAGQNRPDRPR